VGRVAELGSLDVSETPNKPAAHSQAALTECVDFSGRKAFQRPMREGIELLNAIQDVYLAREVTIA
jgi:hypothetical protein